MMLIRFLKNLKIHYDDNIFDGIENDIKTRSCFMKDYFYYRKETDFYDGRDREFIRIRPKSLGFYDKNIMGINIFENNEILFVDCTNSKEPYEIYFTLEDLDKSLLELTLSHGRKIMINLPLV